MWVGLGWKEFGAAYLVRSLATFEDWLGCLLCVGRRDDDDGCFLRSIWESWRDIDWTDAMEGQID